MLFPYLRDIILEEKFLRIKNENNSKKFKSIQIYRHK